MIPKITQGNSFKLVLKLQYILLEDGNEVTYDYNVFDSHDINVYAVKTNNAGTCIFKKELEYQLYPDYTNAIVITIPATLEVGAYGIEVTGVTSHDENWRYKGKQRFMFIIVDQTDSSNYGDGQYIDFYAKVGVIGNTLPIKIAEEYTDKKIAEVNETIDNLTNTTNESIETINTELEKLDGDMLDINVDNTEQQMKVYYKYKENE